MSTEDWKAADAAGKWAREAVRAMLLRLLGNAAKEAAAQFDPAAWGML